MGATVHVYTAKSYLSFEMRHDGRCSVIFYTEFLHTPMAPTVYDRIDAAATINFSTQFGAATIRERRLFESGVYFVRRGYGLIKSEHKRKNSVLVLLRDSESGVRGHHQVRACTHRRLGSSLAEPASSE